MQGDRIKTLTYVTIAYLPISTVSVRNIAIGFLLNSKSLSLPPGILADFLIFSQFTV